MRRAKARPSSPANRLLPHWHSYLIWIKVPTRTRNPVIVLLRLLMLAPVSSKCNWKRRMSSSVALCGERSRNAANRLQLLMSPSSETSVLFELIGARCERRSMLITANQPFGDDARRHRWSRGERDHR